ncbi:TPA: tyrosine-type recombinase/integrase [Klebsiella pneumoniae]
MSGKRDQYLTLDPSGVWYVRITIPDYMKHLFTGKRYFVRSTGTRDIREARLFRDAVSVEWVRLREDVKPKKQSRIEQALAELRLTRSTAKEMPAIITTPRNLSTACPSLLAMLDLYVQEYGKKRSATTISKAQKSVSLLLEHLKKKDVQLNVVHRTIVTGWLDLQKKEKSLSTIQNYVSSLATIWDMAKNRYHDAPQDNPWRGHKLEAKSSKESYEVFGPGELAKVFAVMNGDDEMQNVTLIGMYSGMRLNEICSLRVENIREIEGVLCFEVTEGKSKAAARIIPVHSLITPLVLSLREKPHNGFLFYHASITDRADGKRSTWHTQRFTRAKRKALGEKGTERKVYHSLRHGVAQILDRGGVGTGKLKPVPEDRIALLLGHERGSTESFKTYSKNAASPVELRQYIELIRYPEIEKGH